MEGKVGAGDRRRSGFGRFTRGPDRLEEDEEDESGGRNRTRLKPPSNNTKTTMIQRTEDRRKQKRTRPHLAATPGSTAAGDMISIYSFYPST